MIVPGEIVVGDGLDEALFTTIDRGNGEMQLAVDGRPLYRFSGDAATGDANGQGVGEVWFVATPDGTGIEARRDRRREPGRARATDQTMLSPASTRGRSSAVRRARWNDASPNASWSSCARFRKKWRSCSHVKPMPPWT